MPLSTGDSVIRLCRWSGPLVYDDEQREPLTTGSFYHAADRKTMSLKSVDIDYPRRTWFRTREPRECESVTTRLRILLKFTRLAVMK